MENHVLSIERMQHLRELGLDTSKASMLYCDLYDEEYILVESKHRFDKEENAILLEGVRNSVIYCKKVIPSFTLQDILELLPYKVVASYLNIGKKSFSGDVLFYIEYSNFGGYAVSHFRSESLLDAAYEMLCWCIENKFVETNKNE